VGHDRRDFSDRGWFVVGYYTKSPVRKKRFDDVHQLGIGFHRRNAVYAVYYVPQTFYTSV